MVGPVDPRLAKLRDLQLRFCQSGKILRRFIALPASERADLARQLLLRLENDLFEDDVQRVWGEESERRSAAYQQRETGSRDWQESVNEMRESLKLRRQK